MGLKLLAVDVQYYGSYAVAAGVFFDNWIDDKPSNIYISKISNISDYQSGSFYKRELPCILKLLEEHSILPSVIIIDGYVFLDGINKIGLGKRLYDCLDGKVKVIGVAKNAFAGISSDCEVYRGESKKPLFITAIGEELGNAKEFISIMHGVFRIPTIIKMADQLCRQKI